MASTGKNNAKNTVLEHIPGQRRSLKEREELIKKMLGLDISELFEWWEDDTEMIEQTRQTLMENFTSLKTQPSKILHIRYWCAIEEQASALKEEVNYHVGEALKWNDFSAMISSSLFAWDNKQSIFNFRHFVRGTHLPKEIIRDIAEYLLDQQEFTTAYPYIDKDNFTDWLVTYNINKQDKESIGSYQEIFNKTLWRHIKSNEGKVIEHIKNIGPTRVGLASSALGKWDDAKSKPYKATYRTLEQLYNTGTVTRQLTKRKTWDIIEKAKWETGWENAFMYQIAGEYLARKNDSSVYASQSSTTNIKE